MLFRSPTSEPGRFFAKDPCVIRYKGRGYLYFSKQLIEETGYDRFVVGIAVSENLEDWEEACRQSDSGEGAIKVVIKP